MPLSEVAHFSAEQRNDVASRLLHLCLRELFEFRRMQTDPNWANFLYSPHTGMLYLIDFGATRSFDKKFVDEYLLMVLACASGLPTITIILLPGATHLILCVFVGDRESILSLSHSLGFLCGSESSEMLDAHVKSAEVVGEPFSRGDKPYDFASSDITARLQPLAASMLHHRLTPPPVEAYTLHRKV